jgi:AcrR family transcriptional regulator
MTRQFSDEQRKQQIRSAATRCFVRRGYAATRLLDIAKEAGLSKGGIYFHYRAKEHLFHDILDAQLEALQRRWSFDPVPDQPADRTLARLVIAHVGTMEDDADETRLCNLLVTMAAQDSSFRRRLTRAYEVMRSLYVGVIERGIRERVFSSGDPEQKADGLLSMIFGLGALAAMDSHGRLPLTPEQAADQAVRMLRTQTRASGRDVKAAGSRMTN